MTKHHSKHSAGLLPVVIGFTTLLFLAACSTTRSIPEGDQLYTGISKIEYKAEK